MVFEFKEIEKKSIHFPFPNYRFVCSKKIEQGYWVGCAMRATLFKREIILLRGLHHLTYRCQYMQLRAHCNVQQQPLKEYQPQQKYNFDQIDNFEPFVYSPGHGMFYIALDIYRVPPSYHITIPLWTATTHDDGGMITSQQKLNNIIRCGVAMSEHT